MSDERINQLIAVFGGVLLALGHSGLLLPAWGQFVGEVGTLIAGQALLPRKGDYPLSAFPKYVQDSVRPPK